MAAADNNDKNDILIDREPHHESEGLLSPEFIAHAQCPLYYGSLEEHDGYAKNIGSCGDSVEIFIEIESSSNNGGGRDFSEYIINKIGYEPKGCAYTIACGSALCKLAAGKTLEKALTINPEDVADELKGLPQDHYHCARLAVNTLGEAISEAYRNKNRKG